MIYIMMVIGLIAVIDMIIGSPIYTNFLNLLYLDGYDTLIEKYSDPARNSLRPERYWVNENYKEYLRRCDDYIIPTMNKYEMRRVMKRAKSENDYITLYNIMMDMDDNIEDQISQEYRRN